MANSSVVGILRAILTADTAQFDAGMRKAAAGSAAVGKSVDTLGAQVSKLTPQAERMVKSFQGDKLLYQANNLTAAVQKMGGAMKLTDAEQARVNGTITQAIAKYRALGQEAPRAMLDLERATRQTGSASDTLTSQMAKLAGAFAIGNLAARAATALVGMAKSAIQNAGALVDMSGKTGLSIESLQRMQFVAEQTGTSLETFTQAAFMLGVNVSKGTKEARDAVKDLGLSYEQLRMQRPDQQFETIAAALRNVENEQDRNRIAVALFGKTAKDVLPAIAEGYSDIAKNAAVASDAQIRALDRYADRASQFWRNSTTNVAAFIGKQLALNDAIKEVTAEFTRQGKALDQTKVMAEALRRVELGLVGLRPRTDINLPASGAAGAAEASFVAQLAAVRKEVAGLTADQRKELAAAQQLGADTDELTTRFHISAEAIRMFSADTAAATKNTAAYARTAKEAEKAQDGWNSALETMRNLAHKTVTESLAKQQQEAVQQADRANAAIVGNLKTIQTSETDAAQIGMRTADQRAEHEIRLAKLRGASAAQLFGLESALDRRRLEASIRAADAEFAAQTATLDRSIPLQELAYQSLAREHDARVQQMTEAFILGEQEKREELRHTYDIWVRTWDNMRALGQQSIAAVSDGFASMLVGARGFRDGFLDIWRSIRDGIARILSDVLNNFIGNFLKRMIGGAAGISIGGGGGVGGTAAGIGSSVAQSVGGSVLANALGLGGGAAAAGLAAGTVAPGVVGLATAASTSAAAAGTGAAAAGVATGGGIGAGIAGLATNPFTIGVAAAIGGYFLAKHFFGKDPVNKPRDQFQLQFGKPGDSVAMAGQRLAAQLTAWTGEPGGGHLFAAMQGARKNMGAFRSAEQAIAQVYAQHGIRNVKLFPVGGFVPPGVVQPAVLHGGGYGELAGPIDTIARMIADRQRNAGAGRPTVIEVHNHISTIDASGVREFVKSRDFTDSVAHVFEQNTNFVTSRVSRAIG